MTLRLPAYAKINLRLDVLGKRADGYHDLLTLFERVDLHDTVELKSARSGIRLTCDDPRLPRGPKNLAWKAARLLADECGAGRGVRIRLRKRIPAAAGLGGGSSDAAAVLVGLNRLWRLRLSRRRLLALAGRLGSDVPFFVLGTPMALARGRGERLRALGRPRRPFHHVLVKPPFGISTAAAYSRLSRLGLTPPKTDVNMLLHSARQGDGKCLSRLLANSLEAAVDNRVTNIRQIKDAIAAEGALGCLMSGSGSSVFGLFDTQMSAKRAARRLRARHRRWKVFAVSTA